MPKILFSLTVLVALMGASMAHAANIATLDSRKVMSESAEMKRVATELETMKKAMVKQLESMEKEIEAAGASLDRKRSVMSEEQVVEEETALKAKIREFRIKQQNLNEQLNSEAQLRRKQMSTVLLDVVKNLAQEKSYTMVVEQVSLLYADPTTDITAEVLKRLNAHYENN